VITMLRKFLRWLTGTQRDSFRLSPSALVCIAAMQPPRRHRPRTRTGLRFETITLLLVAAGALGMFLGAVLKARFG
jgi:hypothetical protein